MEHKMLTQVEFEGCQLTVDTLAEIQSGDTYYTPGRNTGPKLLTCCSHNKQTGIVFPMEPGYAFNTGECFKVLSFDGEQLSNPGPVLKDETGANYFNENRRLYKMVNGWVTL
jgi:hypothetical protein